MRILNDVERRLLGQKKKVKLMPLDRFGFAIFLVGETQGIIRTHLAR